ncbi:hypothetical protein GGTG_05984 [Gaeumannomyces tritici R3-111a-1]|uniref:Uncharacterized protein n=1 Tax=Gaeumannomyces tritici (strain R3-111a-1) TaxID=644352 RepID=J3NXH8_GAET3|nr:hypothetical protein GGTG_05984 [Gaeumannomyces tritici R3-111a-1]EJT76060.1 hypothetical protein GGTG_05984 [Gaeumannomyces tritici R3-111a-1]
MAAYIHVAVGNSGDDESRVLSASRSFMGLNISAAQEDIAGCREPERLGTH